MAVLLTCIVPGFFLRKCCKDLSISLMGRKILFILALTASFAVGCDKFSDPSPDYTYSLPDSTHNDIEVSSLAAEGIDEVLIIQMTNRIIREEYKRIDGLLILRNNKLVYENYFHGYTHDILHN